MHRPPVPMEAWAQYLLTLSVDGTTNPWRLPQQLLLSAPIVKVRGALRQAARGAGGAGPRAQ